MTESKGAKGFHKLVGETITAVDDAAVNQVVLTSASGATYIIDAEVYDGVPVFSVKKKAKRKPSFSCTWPYPAASKKEKNK
jgi:hypothetical protein